MKIAVVGHVEWVDFLRVEHLPALGQITPAQRIASHAGGGAVVAAAAIAQAGAAVTFFGAVGDDELAGRAEAELRRQGITTHLARRPGPTRQAITLFDPAGERSIITVGERLQPAGDDPLPWDELKQADGVYFTAGDLAALRSARQAAILATTPRISERLIDPNVPLDALIYSADDRQEQAWAQQLKPLSRYVVETDGARGGRWSGKTSGAWEPARPPGPVIDTYGAGDSFAGGFTLGLASTGDPAQASRAGAAAAALMLTRAGAP